MNCLLCESSQIDPFKVERKPEKSYFHCASCDLIFMHPEERMTAQEEKARYDLHQNEATLGYQSFLEPLVKDIEAYFTAAEVSREHLLSLDFGCGPTAYLSSVFFDKGYRSHNYDLYYYPDTEPLRRTYHVVTATEVWEHLYNPRQDLEKQLRLLKSGGLLGVMTSAHRGPAAFVNWHYRRDLTHVVFYSEKTMTWLAQKYQLRLIRAKSPYWLFQKF